MIDETIVVGEQPTPRENMVHILWWGIALGLVIGCGLNGFSGFDWVYFYYPRSFDLVSGSVVNPPWAYFIITPLAYLGLRVGYVAFTLLNVCLIWLGSRLTGVNRFVVLLSFPALWVLWYGQLDILVMFGVALGFWAVEQKKPVWVGVALLLLLIKPHIGAPLALLYFFWSRDWRTLVVFNGVLLLSLLVWGFDWPITWIKNMISFANPPPDAPLTTAGQQTNITLYPYGLLAWLVILLPMPRVERVIAVLAATFLSVPYAATYSLIVLLVLPVPLWIYVFSSVPLFLGPQGYWITIFAPVGCLRWILLRRCPGSGRALSHLPDSKYQERENT